MAANNLPTVWIIERGERCEGSHIVGVFPSRDLAKNKFIEEANDIAAYSVPKNGKLPAEVTVQDDGSLWLESGIDELSLRPYPVEWNLAITS